MPQTWKESTTFWLDLLSASQAETTLGSTVGQNPHAAQTYDLGDILLQLFCWPDIVLNGLLMTCHTHIQSDYHTQSLSEKLLFGVESDWQGSIIGQHTKHIFLPHF